MIDYKDMDPAKALEDFETAFLQSFLLNFQLFYFL